MARCVTRGSHSFTCHPHTNHTCLYSPATKHQCPLAGTHCTWPGWIDLGSWSHTKINVLHQELNPDTVTHPSTNWARRRVTSLMCTMPLPLSQVATQLHCRGLSSTSTEHIRPTCICCRGPYGLQRYAWSSAWSISQRCNVCAITENSLVLYLPARLAR